MKDEVEQDALLSRTVVDALTELDWLNNSQRLDIATALATIFVAEPSDPSLPTVERNALKSAENAVRTVDREYLRTGLTELSRERMALRRAIGAIDDLIQKSDPSKRSAGQLGWRRKH